LFIDPSIPSLSTQLKTMHQGVEPPRNVHLYDGKANEAASQHVCDGQITLMARDGHTTRGAENFSSSVGTNMPTGAFDFAC
jgi:hypothetical protein